MNRLMKVGAFLLALLPALTACDGNRDAPESADIRSTDPMDGEVKDDTTEPDSADIRSTDPMDGEVKDDTTEPDLCGPGVGSADECPPSEAMSELGAALEQEIRDGAVTLERVVQP